MSINEHERQDTIAASRALWIAVLFQAIEDLTKPQYHQKRMNRDLALLWFNDLESSSINSFIGICNMLDIDPDKTRAAILSLKRKERA